VSELDPAHVRSLLRGELGTPYLYATETTSTQDVLRGSSLPHGAVAVAEHQTEGRGRSGRRWDDAPSAALLVSVLLRPPSTSALPQLSLVAGLAVAAAIEQETKTRALVKWPNDVLVDGRKLAGILVEARPDEGWAVLGIGVNVAVELAELPPDVRDRAATLGRSPADLEATLGELLRHLERRLAEPAPASLDALRARDALRGRPVRWAGGEGTGAGIDDAGALLVRLPDGTPMTLDAGEVHLGS